jgi:hypothetical protein
MNGYHFATTEEANSIAGEIYDLSTRALMAHSIRGVEQFLAKKYNFNTQVVLLFEPVFKHFGRMSWCSVAANSGGLTFIAVDDNRDWDNNHRRFCVAHELYHVLWSIGSTRPPQRNIRMEQICDQFANVLCQKHHEFNDNPANIAKLKFHGLPYRSV